MRKVNPMVTGFELYTVASDYGTADLIIWHRYMQRAPGIVEKMLDANPQLAYVHRYTPFIPPGTVVRVPIDPTMIAGKPQPVATSNLWTDVRGFSN
jgi:phage tail protein X